MYWFEKINKFKIYYVVIVIKVVECFFIYKMECCYGGEINKYVNKNGGNDFWYKYIR